MALPQPVGAPPYVEAMWHYARRVGLAEKGDAAGARDAAQADAGIGVAGLHAGLAVFARSGLAQYLTAQGVPFEPFEDLNDVREALEA